MLKKMILAAMTMLLTAGVSFADEAAKPHLFDDLNDNGISDGAEKADAATGDETPSQEVDDAEQPVDEPPTE